MEYLTKELLMDWSSRHCSRPKEDLDNEKEIAIREANEAIKSLLDGKEITYKPIVFDIRGFNNPLAFTAAMFILGERYRGNDEEIVVRYTFPEDKKSREQHIQFHVVKVKKKK